ncbi:MAG: heme biosynthesis protein HemY [Bradyrhizobium sp.]|nr:MAG: heme biosynthesis protein HemY [Bradyrhizobium sp.]
MVRLLLFLALLALAAFGLSWLAENPGDVALTVGGVEYQVSLMVGLAVILGLAILVAFLWATIRFIFRLPSLVSLAARARRREKGYAALTGGMVAVGSGDTRAASRLAAEARKRLGDEPLTKLLRAQAAQLSGDRAAAAKAFRDMLEHPQTHALGLRGLHIEARRGGDHQAALDYAQRAHRHAALPWAAQAVLDDRARQSDWAGALQIVDSNAAARLIDKPTAARWRAVLKTALAEAAAERDPKTALTLAQDALASAPGLVPAAALSAKLLAANGDLRRAGKTIEAAWRRLPHPDLAAAYLRLRRGDSALDRLARARALARLAPSDSESQLTIGRAALEARELDAARAAIASLIDAPVRPTARVCLLMADIEAAANADGAAREWLARAATAPRDKAWIADGIVSDRWAPAAPSGALDAFVWRLPEARLSAPAASPSPVSPSVPAETPPPLAPPAPPPRPARPVPPPETPPAPVAAAPPPRVMAPASVVQAAPAPQPTPVAQVLMAPTSAPDDPGPESTQESKGGFRLFARE